MLRFLAALGVGLLLSSGAVAQTDCSVNTNRVATVVFPSTLDAADLPISDGALLRATDPRGACVGEVVWSESDGRAMALRGSDPGLSEPDGLLDGDEVTLSVVTDGIASPLTVLASDLTGGDAGGLVFGSGRVFLVSDLGIPVGAEAAHEGGPLLTLDGLAPNPATVTATLRYRLGAAARVASEVFDMLGRRLFQSEAVERAAGDHALALDVTGLPAGVYLARMSARGSADAAVTSQRFTVTR